MAEIKTITTKELQEQKIPPSFITKNGIQSLADKPNQMLPFSGKGGMSPAELKAAFDALSLKLIETVNKIIEYTTSGNVYVPWEDHATNLTELVAALENNMLNVIQVPKDISTTGAGADLYSEIEHHKLLFSSATSRINDVENTLEQLIHDKVNALRSEFKGSEGLDIITKSTYSYVGGRGTCTDTDIVLLKANGYTGISDSAFSGDETIESVVIDEKISVGYKAFAGCKNLRRVRFLGSTPYFIGQLSFDDTVEEIIVPSDAVEKYKAYNSLRELKDKIVSEDTLAVLREEIDNLRAELNKLTIEGLPSAGDTSYVDAKATELMAYTDTKLAEMINSAPEALNTLNELSAALGNDPNFAAAVLAEIGTIKETLASFVDVSEEGA